MQNLRVLSRYFCALQKPDFPKNPVFLHTSTHKNKGDKALGNTAYLHDWKFRNYRGKNVRDIEGGLIDRRIFLQGISVKKSWVAPLPKQSIVQDQFIFYRIK